MKLNDVCLFVNTIYHSEYITFLMISDFCTATETFFDFFPNVGVSAIINLQIVLVLPAFLYFFLIAFRAFNLFSQENLLRKTL